MNPSTVNRNGENSLVLRRLGLMAYEPVWNAMKRFTDSRSPETKDELWVVEHEPVFTQGQAGKPDHILDLGDDIPLVQSDRGGQVTYHGPGQVVLYPLIDIKRLGLGVRDLVSTIEQAVVAALAEFGIQSEPRRDAPGVYVADMKIASLGLRVRHGRSFHGVAINYSMNLEPFSRINPCGYAGLQMTQVASCLGATELPGFESFASKCAIILARALGYPEDAHQHVSEPLPYL